MDEEQVMDQAQSGDDTDVANGGVGPGDAEEQGVSDADQGHADRDDPYGVKKRLGMQAKKHQREMRQMQEHIARMEAQFRQPDSDSAQVSHQNSYNSPGQPNGPSMSEEEKIHAAVRYALGAKEHEERKAKEAEGHAHVQKQYKRMNDEFDRASEKYDDFDDVVRGEDTPFTHSVRDALLLVDNPAEVAYKLGKNHDELRRIAKLHPLDQAREVNKLSFALLGGNAGKPAATPGKTNPMGTVRANPAGSSAVTDKTPASVIRQRMKAGTWK
jgi:hypothetical protein